MNQNQKIKLIFLVLLAAHACFIIYGSIVPFGFEKIPFSEAWSKFWHTLQHPTGPNSKPNLIANILIGIPGPFLFLAVFHNNKGRLIWILIPLAVFYSTLLAGTAEFLQIFLPKRMTMLSDILAQSAGGALGSALWLWLGPHSRDMVKGLIFRDKQVKTDNFLFWCYICLMVLLHALPLDLSARPGPLYSQFEDGRIMLTPFSGWTGPASLLNSLQAVLFWVPVGWFLIRIKGWSFIAAGIAVAIGPAVLELMKIFVLSRTTDTTNIILGAAGGLGGGIIGSWGTRWKIVPKTNSNLSAALGTMFFLGWATLVIKTFWSPLVFNFEQDFLREKINEISFIPLQMYLSIPHTISAYNILEILLYFMTLGVAFASFVTRRLGPERARVISGLFLLIACILAGIVEGGQVFIPGRYPDITDWLLMVTGAMIGHGIATLVWRKHLADTGNS